MVWRTILLGICAIGLTGCNWVNSDGSLVRIDRVAVHDLRYAESQSLPKHLDRASDGCAYMPDTVLDEITRPWFEKHLAAAEELPLARYRDVSPSIRQLRFIWLRSFHAPIIVRLNQMKEQGWQISAVRLSGIGGYDPGEVDARVERELSRDEAASLNSLLGANDLFDPPFESCIVPVIGADGREYITLTADGARWIFEGIDADGYRFTNRHAPDEGRVREAGMFLLSLMDWDIEPVY